MLNFVSIHSNLTNFYYNHKNAHGLINFSQNRIFYSHLYHHIFIKHPSHFNYLKCKRIKYNHSFENCDYKYFVNLKLCYAKN